MKRNHFLAVLFAATLIFLQSCNFPRPTPVGPQNSATATALASTQQAGSIPVTGGTGTPGQTILSVNGATNCWAGPGKAYGLVFTLEPGSGFLVIGKNSAANFWIIANPTGGSCWVSGKNANVAGDTSRLPEYPAPARPTTGSSPIAPPNASSPTPAAGAPSSSGSLNTPGALYGSRVCGKGFHGKVPIWVEDVVLTWQPSAGQTGYRIYQNNQPIAVVTGESTTANIQLTYSRGGHPPADTFGVAAFNDSGSSEMATVIVPDCP